MNMKSDAVQVMKNDVDMNINADSKAMKEVAVSLDDLSLFRLLRIRPREWMQVYDRIVSHPREVIPSSPANVSPVVRRLCGIGEEGHSFPLHDAISLQAPLFVLDKLIEAFPCALDMQDAWGRTPLEIAMEIDGYVSSEESSLLSHQDIRSSNCNSTTSSLLSCLNFSCDELKVLDFLAKNTMIHRKEMYGTQKLLEFEYVSWISYSKPRLTGQLDNGPEEERAQRYLDNLSESMNDNDLDFGDSELRRFCQKWMVELEAFISVVWPHVDVEEEALCSQWIVHYCAASNCPEILLMLAMMLFPEQVTTANVDGDFPIHLACSNRALYGYFSEVYENDGISYGYRLNWETSNVGLKRLMHFYPEGSRKLNRDGLPALHLALKNGKAWRSGVRDLLLVSKESIARRDQKTGLFPFMLAAVEGSKSNIEKNWKFVIRDVVPETGQCLSSIDMLRGNRFCDYLHREALSTVYELLQFKADLIMMS